MMSLASFSCNLLNLLEMASMHYNPDLNPVFWALINSNSSLKAFHFSELNKAILEKCSQIWR